MTRQKISHPFNQRTKNTNQEGEVLVTQYQIGVELQQTYEIKDLQPPVKEAVWPNS